MILKNIFGKTLEAAKKTAYQMYGEDILILEASEATSAGKKAKVTIFSDRETKAEQQPKSSSSGGSMPLKDQNGGVQFERSGHTISQAPAVKESPGLLTLRKYATEQILKEKKNQQTTTETTDSTENNQFLPPEEENSENSSGTVYRRSTVRNYSRQPKNAEKPSEIPTPQTGIPKPEGKFITHFKASKPSKKPTAYAENAAPRADKRAIKALHKRFDKLEALLDSALISANLDYASHPAFQQLVQTGISTGTVARWFGDIIKTGTDPFDQPEMFMAKLSSILRTSLGTTVVKEPEKFMLFAGSSGSGKTSLIMKLCLHPEMMLNKKVAVISVHPQPDDTPYYTILEPFCKDHDIPYYEIRKGLDINEHLDEWKEFEHVLIDTPTLLTESEESFREYWKIRQVLTPLTPLEVHFVVNAASSSFYFKTSTAKQHPIQPDYLAITHLDEVQQWGPLIPFIKEMECNARYITLGTALPTSLQEFDPKWFAQRVLQTY